MLEMLLPLMIGIIIGTVTGMIPGIHPNTTIPIVLSLTFFLDPFSVAVVLISSGVVNSFVSFIPATLLGAPDSETALGVLPGHKLLMEGHGLEAIKLTVIGGLGSILISLLILPIFSVTIPSIYSILKPNIHFILLFIILYMILIESSPKKILFALLTFSLAGSLGLIVLNSWGSKMLFPIFSGLFGIPLLLLSIRSKTSLPEKFNSEEKKIDKKSVWSSISLGSIAGIISGLLPGLGSAQATVLAQELSFKNKDPTRSFLISIGGVTTSNVIYSVLALYLIGKARSAIAVKVGELIEFTPSNILIFLSLIVIASGVGAFMTIYLSKNSISLLKRINYQKLCTTIIVFISILVFIMTGFYGTLIMLVGLSIGLIPNLVGIKKTHSMGCLLVPTILFFAGINLF